MPIHKSNDLEGPYYQWGNQKKYYFDPKKILSEMKAYEKAVRQAQAIYSSGYKKK